MKKLIFLVVTLILLIPERGKAQISIHPELGLSYFPFAHYKGANVNFKKIDFLYGISAYMSISEKFTVQTRISFTDREDVRFIWGITSNHKYLYSDFIRSELNLDFRLNVFLNKYLDLVIGPSIIRTFAEIKDTFLNDDNTGLNYNYYGDNTFSSGINIGISAKLNRLRLHLAYLRIIRFKEQSIYYTGSNRLDLTVSYHLLGGNKGKKR